MELERCRILLCVTETGNLSSAAARLGYTTSGVSRIISALETEFGFPLFFRTHNGVSPTPECERLLPSVRDFVFYGDTCLQTSARIRNLDIGTITIGTAYSAFYVPLSRIISDFRRQYPNITVQLKTGYSTELSRQLQRHELDICLISRREGEFLWLPLCEDELVTWIPANHPLAAASDVPLTIFRTEPYIDILSGLESDNSRVFGRFRMRPNTQFTVADSASAYSMVEAGLGIAMNNTLNSLNLHGNVKLSPLNPRQTVSIGIAALRECSPVGRVFLDFMKEAQYGLNRAVRPVD